MDTPNTTNTGEKDEIKNDPDYVDPSYYSFKTSTVVRNYFGCPICNLLRINRSEINSLALCGMCGFQGKVSQFLWY
jgi:hypothetical protein